jgi:hypothetical protein
MEFVFITINSIEPYLGEINSLLALPKNSKSRVRFKKSWMPEITDYKDIEGKQGFVLLRHFYDAQHIIPLRQIQITKVETVGEIVYIEFSLQQIPCYPTDKSEFRLFIERIYKIISGAFDEHKYPNNNNENLKNLIFLGSSLSQIKFCEEGSGYNEIRNWGVLIEHLSHLENEKRNAIFNEYDFLKLVSIENFSGKKLQLTSEPSINKTDYFYTLNALENYRVKFLQRTFTGRSGNSATSAIRKISLKPDSNVIKSLRSDSIYGKYDILTASFRTEDFSNTSYSDINVVIEDLNKSVSSLPVKLPIKLKSSNKYLVILTLVFVISLIIHYSSDLLSCHFPWFDPELVKKILLPVLIVSGSALTKDWKEFAKSRIAP